MPHWDGGLRMIGIAFIHVLWLLMAPAGVLFVVAGVRRSRGQRRLVGAGVLLLLLSVPALLFCGVMWPVDFLIPGRAARVEVSGEGYTVGMVQEPGGDFYDSYLEVRRADGRVTRLMVDPDAAKWWGLRAVGRGTRTDFVKGWGAVVGSVDFADGTLSGAIGRRAYKLGELSFERRWENGG